MQFFRKAVFFVFLFGISLTLISCGGGGGGSSTAVDVTGEWSGTWVSTIYAGEGGNVSMQLTQTGNSFSGPVQATGSNLLNNGTVSGTVTGSQINFGVATGGVTEIYFIGTVSGNRMDGTWGVPAVDPDAGNFGMSRSVG